MLTVSAPPSIIGQRPGESTCRNVERSRAEDLHAVHVGIASGGVRFPAAGGAGGRGRRPAWIQPPEDVIPGIVPVELILALTPQRAIGLTGIRDCSTGFTCTLHLRLRDIIPGGLGHLAWVGRGTG